MKPTFEFQILQPRAGQPLAGQLDELCALVDGMGMALVHTRVYLTDAENQLDAVRRHALYTGRLSRGAVSFIEQPMLDGVKVALRVWTAPAGTVHASGAPDCMTVEAGGIRLFFHSVRLTDAPSRALDAEAQTMEIFRRHGEQLARRGMTLEADCHRTWIYVRDIDRHYAGVVRGRNRVFAAEGMTAETHFIASTGIGGRPEDGRSLVAVDFLSIAGLGRGNVKYLHAPEYLNPTHEYGVAFERATRLALPQGRLHLVSGTASIDSRGECLYRGDVLAQADRLFLNIAQLLADGGAGLGDLRFVIVYLRDVSDAAAVRRYMSCRFPGLPALVVSGRVCRPEWLIEVEGMALS